MPEDPESRTTSTKPRCGWKHKEARFPEERKDCGGSCLLEKGTHGWHMCDVCIETATPPEHPAWRNH